MKLMQQIYANLFDLNRDLILEHTKRTTNHNSLLAALKNVRPSPPLAGFIEPRTARGHESCSPSYYCNPRITTH